MENQKLGQKVSSSKSATGISPDFGITGRIRTPKISHTGAGFQALLALCLAGLASSCGKETPPASAATPAPTTQPQDTTSRTAAMDIQSLCPRGAIVDMGQIPVTAEQCDLGIPDIGFRNLPEGLLISADCTQKTLIIRGTDNDTLPSLDYTWETLPDGRFELMMDWGAAELSSDGPNQGPCTAYFMLYLKGQVVCSAGSQNQDEAAVLLNDIQWVPTDEAQVKHFPDTTLSKNPNWNPRACKLPQTCFFDASVTMKQCQ